MTRSPWARRGRRGFRGSQHLVCGAVFVWATAASAAPVPEPLAPGTLVPRWCGVAGPEFRARGGLGAPRPELSGPESTWGCAEAPILVHYTLEGADALVVAGDQAPVDGVPDQVGRICDGMDRVWRHWVGDLGWEETVPDGTRGGDDRLDAYVRALDARGYATPEYSGQGWTSYIELDPSVATLGDQVQESVAGHELHHSLQFTHSVEASPFLYEATSTYAQYALFESDVLDAALAALWYIHLSSPERPVDDTGNQWEYAAFVWMKFLVDRAGGDEGVLLALWEAVGSQGGDWREAHRVLGAAEGWVAADFALEHARWNLFACTGEATHYRDEGPACAVDIAVEVADAVETLPAEGLLEGVEVQPWGASYATAPAPVGGGTVRFSCSAGGSGAFRLRLTALDGTAAELGGAEVRGEGGQGAVSVDTGPLPDGATAVLLAMPFGDEPQGFSCSVEGTSAPLPQAQAEAGGCGCATGGAGPGRPVSPASAVWGLLGWVGLCRRTVYRASARDRDRERLGALLAIAGSRAMIRGRPRSASPHATR